MHVVRSFCSSHKLCQHNDYFDYNGRRYNLYSIVRLTEKGKSVLRSKTGKAIVTAQFTNHQNKLWWQYQFISLNPSLGIVWYSTDGTPDELIEEVEVEASADFSSRKRLGVQSPVWNVSLKKVVPKDWEIPELIQSWVIFIVYCFATAIFQWGWRSYFLAAGIMVFFGYRDQCIKQHTYVYHEDDVEMHKAQHKILFDITTEE